MGFNTRQGTYSEIVMASSRQSEKAYVGALIAHWQSGEIPHIRIHKDDFYDPVCSIIFEAINELVNEKVPPEPMNIREKIIAKWKLQAIGWNQGILNVIESDFNYHNLSRYEYAVKDNKRRREVEKVLILMESDESKDSASLLQMWQKLISLATENGWGSKGLSQEAMNNLYEKIAENDGKKIFWFSFGNNLSFLDEATKWIQKWKTYRIGAPSNVGKSQLMYSVINNLMVQWAKVAFFTLENDNQTTLSFLMSNFQKVQNDKIMNGSVPPDMDYLLSIQNNLTIVEDVFDINWIFSRVMELQPDIVILDYIGLISCKGFTEEQKFTEYAIQVQRFVKASQVAWIDLSNLPTNLQQSEDIKNNPQFFGSTFLRNNTDVGIHITPNKQFYDLREKVFQNCNKPDIVNQYKYLSWVQITLSKNRLWPHSITKQYKVDYSQWGQWSLMDEKFISNLELHSI